MVTLGEQAGTASNPHPDLPKLGTPPAPPASRSPPGSSSFWRLGRVFSGSRTHPVDVGRGQTPSSVEWAFWGGGCVVGSRWGDGAAHRPPGCARATVSRAGPGVPAGWERAVPTLGCFPLSAGSPLSWDPGWPGAPLPSCSTTTFLGTPAPPCWSPGTGWACQAPGFARGKGQLVLHARGALWCFLETEVHAILVEPSPHPIGAVRPERQTARLSAAGSSPQKGNGVGVRSGFRLAGGRRKELPTPAAAAGDQDAPRVHQSHCPPHTHVTSELASPHPSAPAPEQTLLHARVGSGHSGWWGRLLRPGRR